MADFASSLPVRTEAAGDVEVKVVDGIVTTNKLKIESDGSINANVVFPSSLEVSNDVGDPLSVEATDLDIRDLSSATDNVEVLQATHDNLNANANLQVGNADVTTLNPVPISDSGASLTVDSEDFDIRDLVFATDKVDVSGSLISILDKTTISSYNVEADVAALGSHTHTYTATGNFKLKRIEASASGKMKIEVKANSNTIFVAFNSTANPNISIDLSDTPISISSTQTIEIIRTNRDGESQNLYSTIIGYNS